MKVGALDEHELLEFVDRVEILLQGMRYAISFKDLDILRKTAIDLQDCSEILNEVIEEHFGSE